jgi:hypothetical protein
MKKRERERERERGKLIKELKEFPTGLHGDLGN